MDAKLQELKRLAKQGDAEDRARYVAALVKAGKLPREKVLLARRLGSQEAQLLEGPAQQGNSWHLLFETTLRNMSGEDTVEMLRQMLLRILKNDPNALSEEDRTFLVPYLRKKTFPTNLTRIGDIFWSASPIRYMVWYWYQPPQYRTGVDLGRAITELARGFMTLKVLHYYPPVIASWWCNFLLYGNIEGLR